LRIANKYRLHPAKEKREFLSEQLREACDLDHWVLEEERDPSKTCRNLPIYCDQANQQLQPSRSRQNLGVLKPSGSREAVCFN